MSTLLRDLPFPAIVEEIDYERIVARKRDRVVALLAQRGIDYTPSESDDIMTLIEMDAYDEMLLRSSLNARIKQLFLAYATGSNLDHIGTTRFGVERLAGKKPTATFTFTLSAVLDVDAVLPAGALLGNGEDVAALTQSVTIPAGSLSADGVAELDIFGESSDVKTEIILEPVPWVVSAKQTSGYTGGASEEDDERYRDRIWLGRERKTTAGSEAMYRYYAMSADVRVADVSVENGGAGVVNVCVLGESFVTDTAMTDAVTSALSAKDVRPLTDTVNVFAASIVDVSIEATLVAKDTSMVDFDQVKARFAAYEGKLGVGISMAKVYDLLSDENVIDVELVSPSASITCDKTQAMRFAFTLHTRSAS